MIKSFQKIMPMSFFVKMLLTAFLTALGGSGYIGFLSEYATYFYAWHNGFRIPAEGSPYLKITITSLTFISILASSLLFLISYVLLEGYRRLNEKMQKLQSIIATAINEILQSTGVVNIHVKALKILLTLTVNTSKIKPHHAILIFGVFIFWSSLAVISFSETVKLSISVKLVTSLIISIFYISILLPFTLPKLTMIISIVYAGVFLLAAPFTLFNQNIYAIILAEIGYGGGSKVEILQNEGPIKYHLLLRTTDSIFVKGEGKTPTEIPLNEIKSINYLSRDIK
ncbi:hypothetical protein LDK53_21760 [Enterobacter sp. K16B]|uniref:hypothetical protein n=1 Tax=Enterobacter sp. K16B TaxID=2878537 RepID=UPI001CDA2ED8|nr:hypothetical protein [Enterobacter sp. K16B]MCA2028568.1 hypothetical protein [Enterobacter sp. K16B]